MSREEKEQLVKKALNDIAHHCIKDYIKNLPFDKRKGLREAE